ncbi:kinase-like domain-containing protein [Podospora conica]|nr:kinase-like domain-containing protein [Schizothecium conicum]
MADVDVAAVRSYTTESTPEVVYCGDFATLVPDNPSATSATNRVIAFLETPPTPAAAPVVPSTETPADDDDDDPRPPSPSTLADEPYHRRFLSLELPSPPSAPLAPETGSAASSFSSTTSDHPTPAAPRGHYRLSLDILPEGPASSWRIGKGSRNKHVTEHDTQRGVDILLVPPNEHHGSGVANVHALLSIHPLSGALMLRSTSSHPVLYLSAAEDGGDVVLCRGEQTVIFKAVNRLRFGALDYILTMRVEVESHFQVLRDQFITTILEAPSPPHPKLDVMPQPYHHKAAGCIMHKPISTGAFGMVRSAVSSSTGNPLAVKRLSVKNSRDTHAIRLEVRIAQLFRHDRPGTGPESGVIPVLSSWCEHNQQPPCGNAPEDVFLAMPLALADFSSTDWPSVAMADRLALFRGTLAGLARIHAAGIMHRDISPKNLLVCSYNPPVAAICDFGKATESRRSTTTTIGPVPTVAPEVWTASPRRPYGPALDVWSLGYAWLSTFALLNHVLSSAGSTKTDESRCRGIQRTLDHQVRKGHVPQSLGALIRSMLAHDPNVRCSAAQALEHSVWDPPPSASHPVVDRVGVSDGPNDGQGPAKRPRLLTPEPDQVPIGRAADTLTLPDTQSWGR